ncbi:hypothetical protein IAR50_003354 [Cryptococcus sp. DSM 104548]
MTTPTKVTHALTRIGLELRHKVGVELVHLAAREYGRDVTKGRRREVSVLFLVPHQDSSEEEGIGHICMAEMLIHLDAKTNVLENIAIRFWYDWEDWTVPQPLNFVKDFSTKPLKVRVPDKRANVPWSAVIDSLLEAVHKVASCKIDRVNFKTWIKRVCEELKVSELQERVYEWEVEKVWRQEKRVVIYPVIRIAFKVMQGRRYKEDPGAVMLMELEARSRREGDHGSEAKDDAEPVRRVTNTSVVYDGEWPVFHHYRTDIPPPCLKDLEIAKR